MPNNRENRPAPLAGGYTSTVKKRSLAALLKRLREEAGLKFNEASRDARVSPTTLRGLETGRWVQPMSDHVRSALDLYGVAEDIKDQILQITYEAREPGWWRSKRYRGVFSNELPGFEAGASLIQTFETVLVPGLLQAAGYIEAVTWTSGITDDQDIERHVGARLQRQEILTREVNPVTIHAVVDAAAITRIPDRIRDEQLRHLVRMTERPNVTVQVIPEGLGLYPGMGEAFTYLTFQGAEAGDLVFIESSIDDRYLEREDETQAYVNRFARLSDAAFAPDATRTYLQERIE